MAPAVSTCHPAEHLCQRQEHVLVRQRLHELRLEPRNEAAEHLAGPAGEKQRWDRTRDTQTASTRASGSASVAANSQGPSTRGLQGQSSRGTKTVPSVSTTERRWGRPPPAQSGTQQNL